MRAAGPTGPQEIRKERQGPYSGRPSSPPAPAWTEGLRRDRLGRRGDDSSVVTGPRTGSYQRAREGAGAGGAGLSAPAPWPPANWNATASTMVRTGVGSRRSPHLVDRPPVVLRVQALDRGRFRALMDPDATEEIRNRVVRSPTGGREQQRALGTGTFCAIRVGGRTAAHPQSAPSPCGPPRARSGIAVHEHPSTARRHDSAHLPGRTLSGRLRGCRQNSGLRWSPTTSTPFQRSPRIMRCLRRSQAGQ